MHNTYNMATHSPPCILCILSIFLALENCTTVHEKFKTAFPWKSSRGRNSPDSGMNISDTLQGFGPRREPEGISARPPTQSS